MSTEPQDPSYNPSNPPPIPGGYQLPPPREQTAASGNPLPPPRRRKSGPLGIIMTIGIVLVLGAGVVMIGVLLIGFVGGAGGDNGYQETVVDKGTSGKKIVVIPVVGIIHGGPGGVFSAGAGSQGIIRQIHRAMEDDSVTGIILHLDTPGGEVIATDEIYHELQKFREERGKVTSCMRSMAASGGYYLAAGTDHIIANRMTVTGSIGVMWGGMNYHGLMEKLGVERQSWQKGELKDLGDPARDPHPQDKAAAARNEKDSKIMQALVDEVYNEFTSIVAKGRNIPVQTVRASPIGDSRIFSGTEALKLKLVDQLGYIEDAYAVARQSGDHTIVRYDRIPGLFDILSAKAEQPGLAEQLVAPEQRLIKRGKIYLLNENLF